MAITAETLRRLSGLALTPEQMAEVLDILAAQVAADEAREAERKAKQNERQKRSRDKRVTVTLKSRDGHGDCHVTEAKSFPDKEIPHTPLENNPSKNPVSKKIPARAQDADEIEEAVEAWNALAHDLGFAKVQRLTEARKASLRLRLSESGGIQGWHVAMGKIRGSPFLRGEGRGGWRADFDFVLQAKSFTKLMEGGYDDKGRKSASSGGERFLDRLIADAESDSPWP